MMKNNGWTVLNNEGFATREKAQRFINIICDKQYEGLEFKIIEKNKQFYILYNLLEKHTL